MRVTLIHPPKFLAYGNHLSTMAIPPLGLAYCAGSLREAGHLSRSSMGSAGDWTARPLSGPSSFGVSRTNKSLPGSRKRPTRSGSAAFPSVPLILGGEHATGLPEMRFAQSPIDFLVQGEGEETLVELVGKLAAGESAASVRGIAYRLGKYLRGVRKEFFRSLQVKTREVLPSIFG